jgi:cysteine-rich repeat protein
VALDAGAALSDAGATVCTAREVGCVDDLNAFVCDDTGTVRTERPCAGGESCRAGTCAVRCGDAIVGSGETCDDGNTASDDGCSSACTGEWVEVLYETFDDGVADGWTTCRGCAGLGCPRVSGTSYLYPGDWNAPCLPGLAASTDRAVRLEFRLTTTSTMTLLALTHLGTPEEGIRVEFPSGRIDYARYVGSWVSDHTVTASVPVRPSSNLWRLTMDHARGWYSVEVDGRLVAEGPGMVGAFGGRWGLDLYGSVAVNAQVDDVRMYVLR